MEAGVFAFVAFVAAFGCAFVVGQVGISWASSALWLRLAGSLMSRRRLACGAR